MVIVWDMNSMGEIEQLKRRIDGSAFEGVETAQIREDYEPVGQMMINELTDSGEYIQRRVPAHSFNSKWRIFKDEHAPY